MKKKIAILGSTGSIGTQTLDVIAEHSDLYEARVLTAGSNASKLIAQARQFAPDAVVIANEAKYAEVRDALADTDVKVYAGAKALREVVTMPSVDVVVSALVGFAGLEPTLAAIMACKTIALTRVPPLLMPDIWLTSSENGRFKIQIPPSHNPQNNPMKGILHRRLKTTKITLQMPEIMRKMSFLKFVNGDSQVYEHLFSNL